MLRIVIAALEIIIGALATLISIKSYLGLGNCPQNAFDCESWAILIIIFSIPIAALALLTGFLQLKYQSLKIQLLLTPALLWFLWWWLF